MVDLDERSAQPVDGFPWMAGASSTFVIDGRTFVFVPGEDWAITHVYELAGDKPTRKLDVRGWSYQMLKVR